MADPQAALRKRQQIAKSGQVMFIWVAGMAAVIGICAVVSFSLWQRLVFQTNIVNAKGTTLDTLRKNNKTIPTLSQNIQALSVDPNLNQLKANSSEQPLQVILDALPADGNSLSFGSSLQNSLLASASGISVQSLTVTPVGQELTDAAGTSSANAVSTVTTGNSGSSTISFHLAVQAQNPDALKQLLANFEKSIRIIDIDNLSIERNDTEYTMTLDAHAYYQPTLQPEIKSEVMTPKSFAKGKK